MGGGVRQPAVPGEVLQLPGGLLAEPHFQQAGLASSRRVSLDSGRREAQACANMGRLCLEQGQLDQAREYYECFRRGALGRAWQGEDGVSLYSQACQGLCLVYGQQAQRLLLAGHDQHAVETLTLAFCTAQEAGDRKTERGRRPIVWDWPISAQETSRQQRSS
ncbi:tetratricopeptide repeat protein 29 [Osmerus eperlanus]|uniref:tetratricopeptide repeat protein 29 n=1 Tax=Osmerus eperlanus TaxID=29151 RepID=UPI002E1687C4